MAYNIWAIIYGSQEGDQVTVWKSISECSSKSLAYMLPFFCGQGPDCKQPTVETFLKAKFNLETNYLGLFSVTIQLMLKNPNSWSNKLHRKPEKVVGITEQFDDFIAVLDAIFPGYFNGLISAWAVGLFKNILLMIPVIRIRRTGRGRVFLVVLRTPDRYFLIKFRGWANHKEGCNFNKIVAIKWS